MTSKTTHMNSLFLLRTPRDASDGDSVEMKRGKTHQVLIISSVLVKFEFNTSLMDTSALESYLLWELIFEDFNHLPGRFPPFLALTLTD